MKKEMKFIPFKLQLFAEGDGEQVVENNNNDEALSKLQQEVEKQKREKDKYAKELADLKKANKEKLSEEEKKQQLEKEKDEMLANAQKELLGIKMSKEFLVAGFDEKTTNELIESFNKGDSVEFAKTISQHIKLLVENARKEEKELFQQSAKVPPSGSGNRQQGLDPIVERYINKNANSNLAREKIFGKK